MWYVGVGFQQQCVATKGLNIAGSLKHTCRGLESSDDKLLPATPELIAKKRYNQTIKSMFRKLSRLGVWWDQLQDVAQALRVLPVKASGYSPFVFVYKKLP